MGDQYDGATVEDLIEGQNQQVDNVENAEDMIAGEAQEGGDREQAEGSNDIQELKTRLQMTEQQLEYFRELLRQNQDIIALMRERQGAEAEEKDILEELDPDEPLTARQMKALRDKILEKSQKNIQELDNRYRKSLAIISEKAARLRYNDYDEVLPYAVEMAKQDPMILQRIAMSDDPAEEAYQWGLRNPKYIEKIKGTARRDVADKIRTNLNKSSGSVPNRGRSVSQKDPLTMTPEEFAEYKRRVLEK